MTQATPPPRPTAMPINLDGIPPCLKERPQWVLWRYELDAERQDWAKIPRQLNGRKAKANDPNGSAPPGAACEPQLPLEDSALSRRSDRRDR